MKFITRFIKHSLQPSRQAATDFPRTNRTNKILPVASPDASLNNAANSETQAAQPETNSSSFQEVTPTPVNNGIEISTQHISQDSVDTPEIAESRDYSSPEIETANTFNSVQSSPSTQAQETENSTAISNTTGNIISNSEITDYPDNFQQEPNSSDPKLTTSVSPVTTHTQGSTANNPEDKELSAVPAQIEDIEAQLPSLQNELNPMSMQAEFPAEEQPKSSSLAIQQKDIDPNKTEPPVAIPVNRQATASTLQQQAFVSQQSREKNPSKPVETPQVRIGNINILIDDQAAPKPVTKTASNSASPSIPFGLRGL